MPFRVRSHGVAFGATVRLAPLVLFALLLDCTTFAPLAANSCGNGVIDASEDCDSFAGLRMKDGVDELDQVKFRNVH